MVIKSRHKQSFTLVELMVTVSIIAILTVINLGVYSVYRSRTGVDQGVNDLKDLIAHVQNMAVSPDSSAKATATSVSGGRALAVSHYLIYLNTHPTEQRTPYYTPTDKGPYNIVEGCQHLAPNGGYCIAEIMDYPNAIVGGRDLRSAVDTGNPADPNPVTPTVMISNCGTESTCQAQVRYVIARGRLNLASGVNISVPDSTFLSQPVDNPYPAKCTNGDCGYACLPFYNEISQTCPNPDGIRECPCSSGNEGGIFKVHFRVWDGAMGINGKYPDVNPIVSYPTQPAQLVISGRDGQSKSLYMNLRSSAMWIR